MLRQILVAFIMFAVLLTISFLWQEIDYLTLDKTINFEKVAAYFTSLGAVAAAVSIYFLYGQLKEMRDTRKAAYQPDLYPAYSKFQVQDIARKSSFGTDKTPVVQVIRLEDNKPQNQVTPFIELHNIGLGAAKSIKATWEYNIADVDKLITGVYYHYKVSEPEKEDFDFLQANGKLAMNIPHHYFNCCGEQLNQTLLDTIEPVSEKPKPVLKLRIFYYDIQNNEFDKSFKVKVEALTEFVDLKFSAVGNGS